MATLSYFDKSRQMTVSLPESTQHLLVNTQGTDEEAARVLVLDPNFKVQKIGDNLFTLVASEEQGARLRFAVDHLKNQETVKEVTPALVDPDGAVRYRLPRRIVAKFDSSDVSEIEGIVAACGATVSRCLQASGLVEIEIPRDEDIGACIHRLNQYSGVRFAEPGFWAVDDAEPTFQVIATNKGEAENIEQDQEGAHELAWNLNRVRAAEAWQITRGSRDVVVFVVDGFPQPDHESYRDAFTQVPDGTFELPALPLSSHATGICGIVAGQAGRIRGVAPGVRVVPVPVDLRTSLYANRAEAIYRTIALAQTGVVRGEPVRRAVLSCSWKTAGDVSVIRTALAEAVAAGMIVVCSAGNNDTSAAHFPSDYSADPVLGDGIISVAGTGRDDRKAAFSNYSATVDLCAPAGDGLPLDAGDIFSSDIANQYAFMAGTSFAAPHVAATAALMLSVQPTLTPGEVKRIIKQTADSISALNLPYVSLLGAGRLNSAAALAAITDVSQPSEPQEPYILDLGLYDDVVASAPAARGTFSISITTLPNSPIFQNLISQAKPWRAKFEQATGRFVSELTRMQSAELPAGIVKSGLPPTLLKELGTVISDYYATLSELCDEVQKVVEDVVAEDPAPNSRIDNYENQSKI